MTHLNILLFELSVVAAELSVVAAALIYGCVLADRFLRERVNERLAIEASTRTLAESTALIRDAMTELTRIAAIGERLGLPEVSRQAMELFRQLQSASKLTRH